MSDAARLDCDTVRERLLEIDLGSIPGAGHPIGSHVSACPECARVVELCRARVAALDAALSEPRATTGRLSDARALAVARAGVGRAAHRRRPLVPTARWVAAAAVLALATWPVWRATPSLAPTPEAASERPGPATGLGGGWDGAGEGFSVEAPAVGGVAVFATRNPKIRVVWYYEKGPGDGEGQ